MNINTRSQLLATYSEMDMNVVDIKQRIGNQKQSDSRKKDECYISEEGKTALQEKMSEVHNDILPHITGKLSDVSQHFYVDLFGEKLQTAEKSKDMDEVFLKMQSINEEMQKEIESKYDNSQKEEYFVSQNGTIEKLTKEKELDLLQFAYESHRELMTNSMKILEKGFQIWK